MSAIDDTFPGWCCLWASHLGGVGVPCRKVDGYELCVPCAERHEAAKSLGGQVAFPFKELGERLDEYATHRNGDG